MSFNRLRNPPGIRSNVIIPIHGEVSRLSGLRGDGDAKHYTLNTGESFGIEDDSGDGSIVVEAVELQTCTTDDWDDRVDQVAGALEGDGFDWERNFLFDELNPRRQGYLFIVEGGGAEFLGYFSPGCGECTGRLDWCRISQGVSADVPKDIPLSYYGGSGTGVDLIGCRNLASRVPEYGLWLGWEFADRELPPGRRSKFGTTRRTKKVYANR